MTEARWEWTLPGGARVAATIASPDGVESVFLGPALLSQSARGARLSGHELDVPRPTDDGEAEPMHVTVTFDPRALICVLRVEGEEIAPRSWPQPLRPVARHSPARSVPVLPIVLAALGLLGASAAFFAIRSRAPAGADALEMTGAHRADSGLFIARFPASLSARPAAAPTGMSGVVLLDQERADAIVILAAPPSEATSGAWLVHKHLHGEALANVPRADGQYEETARHDGTCLGQPGAIVMGRVNNRRGEAARVWSCALSRGGAGYVLMSAVREKATDEEERLVRRVIDATELTELGVMMTRPQ